MDIIVTTPKSQMANAAREAQQCIEDDGGEYFRRFPTHQSPHINIGERVFYVEDGYLRGYARVSRIFNTPGGMQCDTTGRFWPKGFYVVMPACSWRWIYPIPMRGFPGFRYARSLMVSEVGGWLDPKPVTEKEMVKHDRHGVDAIDGKNREP